MTMTSFKSASAFVVAMLVSLVAVGCSGNAAPAPSAPNNGSGQTGSGTQTIPPPVISAVSPPKVTAGGVQFRVYISGNGFLPNAAVLWNGSPRPTDGSSGGKDLNATINAADIAQAGTAKISVQNPATGSAPASTSNAVDITISALRLEAVSPAAATEGSGDTTLTLTGSGFSPGTVVRWNGTERPTILVNSSTLNVIISAADVTTASLAEITVVTAAPNSEVSNIVLFPVVSGSVGVLDRVSLGDNGEEGHISSSLPAISRDGSLVAFAQGDTNAGFKVMLRSTCLNTSASCSSSTNVVSIGADGKEISLIKLLSPLALSGDGRIVAFSANPFNFLDGGLYDVLVRDTCLVASTGCSPSTLVPSRTQSGTQVAPLNAYPSLSADGRYVAFTAGASDGYGFDSANVFLFDTCRGASTSCVSLATSTASDETGRPLGYAQTFPHSFSSSGRYLAYSGDANYGNDYVSSDLGVWLHDTCIGATDHCTPSTVRVSVGENGNILQGFAESVAVSGTGRYVAFSLYQTDPRVNAIFLRDTCLGAPAGGCVPSTIRVSVNSAGQQLSGGVYGTSISDDGRLVTFAQEMFDAFSQRGVSNVLLRDTCMGVVNCKPRTLLLSQRKDGTQGDGPSYSPMISADGRFVVFESSATNLVPGDTNGLSDIFIATTGAAGAISTPLPHPQD